MEYLERIRRTFENIRATIKYKDSEAKLAALKRDIQSLSTELTVLGKQNHGDFIRGLAMEGYLALLTAKVLPITLVEKRNVLQSAFEKLKPYALRDECLFIYLRIQNLLCYYLIHLEQLQLAREILEATEDIYDKICPKADKYLDAEHMFTCDTLPNIRPVSPEKIDRVITNNVQMQAFLYNKMNIPDKYCLYNHTALRRQLDLKEGTPQDWALRAARLGNYFTYLHQIGNARHHLCAAYHVLRTCHDNCKLMPEEFVLQKADFEIHFLEIGHHFVKYGLTLFKLSKKHVLDKYFADGSSKADLWKTVNIVSQNEKEIEKSQGDMPTDIFCFASLDLKEIEDRVPSKFVSSLEDARKLFSFTHKWILRTKHYYDFEHHPAQYISCSLQQAELYEHLAFFEKNIDNQYNIQKRRAEVLETLNSLLKTCDSVMSVQIDVIRELSQVQLELMALNLQKLWREESQTNIFNPDADADSIINSLDSASNKTLTERTLNASSKNIFLRKMEAATALNGKLFRLSGQLGEPKVSDISQLSFESLS
ncbi:KIF-binding protein-like [Leguminivora glycinivorella]|uniref:KIF-binding protein-like n=1 Tax=Leguminivora glycinivorella TaxID=1035111 RepID=UPI00200CB1F9|nr:KIF-binding protein-like [Leguminivora glycinivorella]